MRGLGRERFLIGLVLPLLAACSDDTGPTTAAIGSVVVTAYVQSQIPSVDFPVYAVVKTLHDGAISDSRVTWTTSDASVATVRSTGPQTAMVMGAVPGTATISALAGSQSGSVLVTVTPQESRRPDAHAFLWTPDIGMIDLGVLPGTTNSAASAINNAEQIVGRADSRPFLWTAADGMVPLSGFPTPFAVASGINEAGQVVGYMSSGGAVRAFVWTSNGGPLDIGVLPRATDAYARAINNAGEIVGKSGGRPFRWSASAGIEPLTVLSPGTGGDALALNTLGEIVGSANGSDAAQRAVRWGSDGNVNEITCCNATGAGINAAGQVAGNLGAVQHAFVLTAGEFQDVGTLPAMTASRANAINSLGQVTGTSRAGALDRAFIWSKSSGMKDLGSLPGRSSCFGFAINDRGQVVGYCD